MAKRLFPQQIRGIHGDYGVRIADISRRHKIEIHSFAENCDAVNQKLKKQIGVTIPKEPNQIVKSKNNVQALWMAPHKALVVSDKKIMPKLSSQEALVSDQTHGRAAFRLYGHKAAYVLSKGIAVDCTHPPPVFQSIIHGMALVIAQCEDGFDIYVYRSFAESFQAWLLQAALETGYLQE